MSNPEAQALFCLIPLSRGQLEQLAASLEPPELSRHAEAGALPPPWVAARHLDAAAVGTAAAAAQAADPWSHSFLIARTRDHRFVGACGYKAPPRAGRVEVGYGVAVQARGQGAATAALEQLAGMAFAAGVSEVVAEIVPDNRASARVAEKAGFVPAGTRVDEDGERVVQWLRTRPPPRA